jgi:uncharacterized protein YgfB (UPF0149 family)
LLRKNGPQSMRAGGNLKGRLSGMLCLSDQSWTFEGLQNEMKALAFVHGMALCSRGCTKWSTSVTFCQSL